MTGRGEEPVRLVLSCRVLPRPDWGWDRRLRWLLKRLRHWGLVVVDIQEVPQEASRPPEGSS